MAIERDIKQKRFKSVHEKALINLLYTSELLSQNISDLLKKFGLTSTQYNVLRILAGSSPNPLTPTEIKQVMLSQTGDLTRLIDRMKAKGMVDRQTPSSNRRLVHINISKSGTELLTNIAPQIQNIYQDFMINNLTEQEAESLSNLLDKVRL